MVTDPAVPGIAESFDLNSLMSVFPSNPDRELALSDTFLLDEIIDSPNFGRVPIDPNFWTSGPQDDRSWQWTMHSFLPLDSLIARQETEVVCALIRSWQVQFERVSVASDFPWHDHATALRLDRLSRIALTMPNLDYSDLAERHADLLLDENFYERHTNHGFDQSSSLILASIAFRDCENSSQWRQTGIQRLTDEIDFAFTDEGVHVENSPAYHVGMISNLVRARKLMAAAGSDGGDLDSLYDRALIFAAWVTRPDRYLAYLGDTSAYRPNIPDSLAELPSYPLVHWTQTGGRAGRPTTEKAKVFQASGYAAYRSSWKPWEDQTHIVMKCGFDSRYHRQDDDLNILVYAYGEDWFIDSGLYNHNQSDPVRVYMRSALAHNIPYFPDLKPNRTEPEKVKATLKQLDQEDVVLAVEGCSSMYPGGTIARRLFVKNRREFSVFDRFANYGSKPRFSLFHVPLDKRISVSPGKARIRGKNAELVIRTRDGLTPECKVYRGLGADFPSCTSQRPNQKADSQVIVFGPFDDQALGFRMLFTKQHQA